MRIMIIAAIVLVSWMDATVQEPPDDKATAQKAPGDKYYDSAEQLLIRTHACLFYEQREVDIAGCKELARLYEKAIEVGVSSDKAYFSLAWASGELAQFDDEGNYLLSYNSGKKPNQKWRYKMMDTARRGLELYPESTDLIDILRRPILRGDDYVSEEEYVALTRRLRELTPRRPEWFLSDYEDLMEQGRVSEAVDKYVKYIIVSDRGEWSDSRDHMTRAQVLAKQGHKSESVKIHNALMDLGREGPYTRMLNNDRRSDVCGTVDEYSLPLEDYSEFPDFVERAERFRFFCGPKEHLVRGEAALLAGNMNLAVEELELQIEENPYHTWAYLYLPEAYGGLGQTDKAGETVKRYFDFEEDGYFRCIYHEEMGKRGFQRFAPDIMREVGEECREWRAEQKSQQEAE